VDALRRGRRGAGGTHRGGRGEFVNFTNLADRADRGEFVNFTNFADRADRADFVNFTNLADRANFAPDVNGASGNCRGVWTT